MIVDPAVSARNVRFMYRDPDIEAIETMSFDIPSGSFTAVMGPNGSGKTTLLRLMIGLLSPTHGTITLMGHDPSRTPDMVQRLVGYVPQFESINVRLPLTGIEIVELGVSARAQGRLGRRDVRERAAQALDSVGLLDIGHHRYGSLSGGQRQRVLIARALAVDPKMVVLDEPFSAMDIANQRQTAELLRRLVQEDGLNVIAVVHNVNALVHFIDHVILLNRELIAVGAPDSVLQTANLQRAYGTSVPIIVCEEGFRHPIMEDSRE